MDEIWERAVETALDGHTDHSAARTLTLDGAVKCVQGRLPPPAVLEKFENLQHLSVANIGVSSLEQFPRLTNLQKLILSDNRISGGLEFLVEAGLHSLRDLDLSNNRIQYIEDLAPLAQLKLVSLDLYECPVTRVRDYRSRVFGLIKSLKYLDKMDAEGNERPESDEEEDEEDDDEDEDEDDPGSGEIDGEDRLCRMNNGHSKEEEGVADVDVDEDEDEDEESDADEEETETGRRINGQSHEANGFHIGQVGRDEEEEDDDDENVSDEEVDDEDEDEEEEEEEDIVEAHEIGGSDDEEDGVEDDEEEEVDNYETDLAEPGSTGVLTSTEGEIDAHEHGEDDGDDDDDGETGEEEEQGVENDVEFEDEEEGEEEDDDYGEGYLVQPVGQAEEHDAGGSDMEPVNEEDDVEEEEEVEDDEEVLPSSSQLKRKRSGDAEEDVDDDEDDEEEDVEFTKSSKKHR
ncbi:hypothetical protein like AT3G50690 [Hibiscus trionum]|uniref:Acidic leucine-rich nuclear phosphoprotein 32-related protein n=1 Tax=Hibiscus trionum TaxID=183268 RepID=A0A9W7H3T3_HIBTR|nr:hypothetical protein like AT3G50690 [Hibiscus trionum]